MFSVKRPGSAARHVGTLRKTNNVQGIGVSREEFGLRESATENQSELMPKMTRLTPIIGDDVIID